MILPPLILLIVIASLLFFPIRTCINYCIRREEQENIKKPYADAAVDFFTDYDIENPVTKQIGYVRMD